MKSLPISVSAIVAIALLASCSAPKKTSSASSASPQMLRDGIVEWTVTGVAYNNSDFSGLCFSADGKRMIAAFNSAALYWLDIPVEGQALRFSPIEVEGSDFRAMRRDCEAVTVNGSTGDIWYGQERNASGHPGATLYKVKAPAYAAEEPVFSFDKYLINSDNSGIEGLAWTGGDTFIVAREGKWNKKSGTQSLEPMMVFFSESKGVTGTLIPDKEIKQIADIVYDQVRDCIWILDSDYDKILYRCSLKGEILDRFSVAFADNAEALLLDRKRGCIWIGSDESPSKLYKVPFKNL